MKKIISAFLVLIIVLLVSCQKNYNIEMSGDYHAYMFNYSDDIRSGVVKIDFDQVNKREPILSVDEAAKYAEQLMFSDSKNKVFRGLDREEREITAVGIDNEKYIWMVGFGFKQDFSSGVAILGFETYIAFNVSDGTILSIWNYGG